jgi:hypothetical protein
MADRIGFTPGAVEGDGRLPFDVDVARLHLVASDRRLARLIERAGPFRLRLQATRSTFGALAEAIAARRRRPRRALEALPDDGRLVPLARRRFAERRKSRRGGRMKLEGGCACGAIRYALGAGPLIVHACHCRDCQRLTGSAFVVNLWIEAKFVDAKGAAPKSFRLEGGGGKPHDVFFCDACGTYVWSRYHGAPGDFLFVRAGTLDRPDAVRPDVHIFTRSKLPWLVLPAGVPAFRSFYKIADVWTAASRERLRRGVPASR